MGKEFIVDGAICMCKFGTASGRLKVPEQQFAYLNGEKLTATSLSLGNAFYPPGFTVCKVRSSRPKPCMPAIVQWTEGFKQLEIGNGGYALTEKSKATCANGCPDCIEIMMTGQIQLPGIAQILSAKAAFQNEMDPLGASVALTDHQVDTLLDIF